ncbi:hypothetical protein [Mangrovicoccus ximenensis]|uniref:hypothetical protein n=1 Tax=Mangrovicoccus ximenensis TaxID=1911570 RepID=UPI000D35A31B|nr:hypothetical protein [Mangrovicoccus ximenensis]
MVSAVFRKRADGYGERTVRLALAELFARHSSRQPGPAGLASAKLRLCGRQCRVRPVHLLSQPIGRKLRRRGCGFGGPPGIFFGHKRFVQLPV